MNKSLRELQIKLDILNLHNQGMPNRAIGRKLGIAESTIRAFLNKQTHISFWNSLENQGDCVEDDQQYELLNKLGDIQPKIGFNELPKINLPPRTKDNAQIYNTVLQTIKSLRNEGLKIIVIADTQCKPNEDLSYMSWIGKYINDKKPDVVVHIGDHYDFPSLSSYDKGKKSFEGRRLKADIEAGNLGMKLLLSEFQTETYNPRLVFCTGNHCDRFDRLSSDMPELDGFVGTDILPLKEMGWEVYPFLKPVEIAGIFFVHYLANPFTGKPYAGTALNQLKTVGRSFVVGHKQCLDVAIRPTIDGKHQIGIINGAAYPFDEGYKGYQGNNHFRGITVLHEVKDGFGTPMFVSLDYLKNKYA